MLSSQYPCSLACSLWTNFVCYGHKAYAIFILACFIIFLPLASFCVADIALCMLYITTLPYVLVPIYVTQLYILQHNFCIHTLTLFAHVIAALHHFLITDEVIMEKKFQMHTKIPPFFLCIIKPLLGFSVGTFYHNIPRSLKGGNRVNVQNRRVWAYLLLALTDGIIST